MNSEKGSRPERLLAALPEALRRPVSDFYNLPLASKRELIALINDYADEIARVADRRGDLDVNLADCIAGCCLTLLNEQWDGEGDHRKRLIQSACYYYVENDDEDRDLESVHGFDDDAELLNLILEHLDRPDLVIQI
jgi:hypothetical protein